MAPKAVDARERLDRNPRFRGHGPLLQFVAHPRGIYKGSSPCWYATRPSRRGPPARDPAMGPSYMRITAARQVVHPRGDIQGALPLLVRHAAKPPRATGPRGGPWPPFVRQRTVPSPPCAHARDPMA